MQAIKDNFVLIATILATVLIGVVGLVVLSASEGEKLTPEEKTDTLVREDSIVAGNLDSTVTVVEFSDFQCPACAYYADEFKNFKQDYQDRVKIVFRHFPLHSIHPLAQIAAESAEAAAAQGKFWEYNELLYKNQTIWSILSEEKAKEAFVNYAEKAGVEDLERFKSGIDDGTYTAKVNSDENDANALNLSGTPTVFVNGEQLSSPTYDNLSAKVDELLAANVE